MNTVTYIILIVAAVFALLFIMAAFKSNHYTIVREIVVDKPVKQVFGYLRYLKNANNYSKWQIADPNIKTDYTGVDGMTGFIVAWDSKKAGKGEQEIKKIKEGERIDYELRFEKPFKGTAYSCLETEAKSEEQTQVIWSFSGERNLMLKVMHMLFNLPNVMGRDLAESLNTLKGILEEG